MMSEKKEDRALAADALRPTGARHTPGPWKIGGTGIFPSVMDAAGFAIVSTGMSKRHILECRSNARLIAAAPDLYEACAEFVRKVETGEARSTRSYKQMLAALNKAQGQ